VLATDAPEKCPYVEEPTDRHDEASPRKMARAKIKNHVQNVLQ
jgi:hypothetical protein